MKNFKALIVAVALILIGVTATAQRKDVVTKSVYRNKHRQEIIIPQILGYNVYTADLHTHTIYSDGNITPSLRVREAWLDGLDILAITDHIEYRRVERDMLKYMDKYIKEEYRDLAKGVNTNLQGVAADERGILVDLNRNYEEAEESNQQYGMLIVRGVEITRNEGHYNAIFTKDNNKIYHPDIKESIKNAVKQGAFVFQNHPKRDNNTESKMTPLAEELHEEGYVRGIEIGNGYAFWSWLVPYCFRNNQTMVSTSDGHSTMAERFYPYYNKDAYRNMTLILAKKCDEKSIKEALFKGRTIAYHSNKLIGKEEYLAELFKASVSIEHVCDTKKSTMVILTNKSSFPYSIQFGKATAVIEAMGAVQISLPKDSNSVDITVTNLITGGNKRAKVSFMFERKPTNPYLEENPSWYPR